MSEESKKLKLSLKFLSVHSRRVSIVPNTENHVRVTLLLVRPYLKSPIFLVVTRLLRPRKASGGGEIKLEVLFRLNLVSAQVGSQLIS